MSVAQLIVVSFATISNFLVGCSSTTVWQNLFRDADLTFLFYMDGLKYSLNNAHYQTVITHNLCTPIRFFVLRFVESDIKFHPTTGNFTVKEFEYRQEEKTSRPKAVIVWVETSNSSYQRRSWIIYRLSRLVEDNWCQEYIFVYAINHWSFKVLLESSRYYNSAKMIVIARDLRSALFILCYTCHPMSFSRVDTISLSDILQTWYRLYRNMNKFFVLYSGPVNATCGLHHNGFVNLNFSTVCVMVAITEKYNLTLVEFETNVHLNHNPSTIGQVLYSDVHAGGNFNFALGLDICFIF
ncbi:hypothetical protein Fcan01_18124 [Folsomia candida]|uniref:Uncharacterized protein n=1 Tax=Folsomia candida TaxID=158441 RepID=A0A226DQY8_FOLCA|nr:hypothetical protein Fcan01_18124 [Folsomia candida]